MSIEHEASRFPSGLKATVDCVRWPRSTASSSRGRHGPEAHGIVRVAGAGDEALPVRAEGQRVHVLRMAAQARRLRHRPHVPQADGVIVRGVGEVPAVAGENGLAGPLARKVGALSPRRDAQSWTCLSFTPRRRRPSGLSNSAGEGCFGNPAKGGPAVAGQVPRHQRRPRSRRAGARPGRRPCLGRHGPGREGRRLPGRWRVSQTTVPGSSDAAAIRLPSGENARAGRVVPPGRKAAAPARRGQAQDGARVVQQLAGEVPPLPVAVFRRGGLQARRAEPKLPSCSALAAAAMFARYRLPLCGSPLAGRASSASRLERGAARLPDRPPRRPSTARQRAPSGQRRAAVGRRRTTCPAAPPPRAGRDRLALVQETAQILRQRLGRGVAAAGLLLQALQADGLQVARAPTAAGARPAPAPACGCWASVSSVVGPLKGGRPVSIS